MWTCPTCHRTFKNTNQDHSCQVTDLESHFLQAEPDVKAAFEKIYHEVSAFGEFKVNSVKHAILFTAESHFLAFKPKRKWLDIEFVLPFPVEGFPIHKTVQAAKSKWAHFIRLESPEEVDPVLIDWLRQAYQVSSR